MKRVVALFSLLFLTGLIAAADDKAGPKDNMPPPGFTALFNGKDLTGWQGLVPVNRRAKMSKDELAAAAEEGQRHLPLPHWAVKDGVIVYDGKGNNLQTSKDYGNFELYVDWKIGPKGDSGLYLRGNPQVQIWDSDESTGAKGLDKGSGSGGLWNNKDEKNGKRPLKKADKPVGEWNTFHIVMKGDKVWVKLNGVLVVNGASLDNYWDKGKPLPAKGPIELQHHGDHLWFKNIYIKELPD